MPPVRGTSQEFGQFGGQPSHLFLEWFAVVLLLLDAHIASWREDIVLLGDILGGDHRAESLDIIQGAVHKGVIGGSDLLNILVSQLPQLAGHHSPHFAGVDKERLALLLLVSGQEPEGDRDLGGVEQLGRHGDDAVHQIVLDDIFADLALAAGLGGQGTIGQYHTDAAVGGQMPDHVLEPCKVGVAGGRRAVLQRTSSS